MANEKVSQKNILRYIQMGMEHFIYEKVARNQDFSIFTLSVYLVSLGG